jgi:hypothetical protein
MNKIFIESELAEKLEKTMKQEIRTEKTTFNMEYDLFALINN